MPYADHEQRQVQKELEGLFDELDELLKNPDVITYLTARRVNTSLAMVAADGCAPTCVGRRGGRRGPVHGGRGDSATARASIRPSCREAAQGTFVVPIQCGLAAVALHLRDVAARRSCAYLR